MDLLMNIIIIVGSIVALVLVVYFFISREVATEISEEKFSYESLKSDVSNMVNSYTSMSVTGLGLTKQVERNQEEQRRTVASCVRRCCSGDAGAREVVQDLFRNYLTRDRGVNEQNILYAIPFDRPRDMTERQLALCMILHFDEREDKGFRVLLDDYHLCVPKTDEEGHTYYDITEEDIRNTYAACSIHLSFKEQVDVLVQMLYEDILGLGIIDVLNRQKGSIEELQIGMTGVQQKVYDYKQGLIGMTEHEVPICYSKDAVHALIGGNVVRLSYLSFGTEDEKQRVIRNLILNCEAGELTKKRPLIVVDTVDGRRVSVARPPVADAWIGLVRKFDSIRIIRLDGMYNHIKGGDILTEMLKQIVRAGFSIGFTGEMASGKTTLFRAALRETRPDLCIRVIEAGSFELDTRQYLMGRNCLALRVTDSTPEDEVMEFIRKTTGNCFCIGEVNSAKMAVLTMDADKISKQTMFSAHYTTTEELIAAFTNANLCEGGYTSEKLAEMDAVRSLGFDVHMSNVNGRRYVKYVNEIVPKFDTEEHFKKRETAKGDAAMHVAEAVREVRKQLGTLRTYEIREILKYDEENECYVFLNKPSLRCMNMAREYMTKEQYNEFVKFFDTYYGHAKIREEQGKKRENIKPPVDDGVKANAIETEIVKPLGRKEVL